MIELAWPWLWLLAPVPFLIAYLGRHGQDSASGALLTPLFEQWRGLVRQSPATGGYDHRFFFSYCLWLLLLLAASKPVYVGDPIQLPSQGRELLLAVDVSGSMKEQDMPLENRRVNRLELVKHVLSDFIERREGDRLGLILFGEQAFLQSPLSFDRDTVKQYLKEAEIGIAGENGTAIGDAIGMAIKRYQDKALSNRILILLTDGQNTMGVKPLEASRFAKDKKITIYTIGIGADSQIIQSGFFGNRRVNPSRDLDEKTLKAIAEMTGGKYFRGRNQAELENIYEELDRLVPVEADALTFRPTKLLFFYPLAAALTLFLLLLVSPIVTRLKQSKQPAAISRSIDEQLEARR